MKTREKFLSLFQNYMTGSTNTELKKRVIFGVPIECWVLNISPQLVLSDGFHKVNCELTIQAVKEFKKQYPAVKLRDLLNTFITLLDYEPYTYVDETGALRLKLGIQKFVLNSIGDQKKHQFVGDPKRISVAKGIQLYSGYEISKHMKDFIGSKRNLNDLPQLEKIILERNGSIRNDQILKFTGHGEICKEGCLNYEELQMLEDSLTEEAGKSIIKHKNENKIMNEQARNLARHIKNRPKSLHKDLVAWADKCMEKKEINSVQNVEISLQKETPSKRSINKASELKYNAKRFKKFLEWKEYNHCHDGNSVSKVLSKDDIGIIKVDFKVPEKPVRAFDKWINSKILGRKREMQEVSSCLKSVAKKPKL